MIKDLSMKNIEGMRFGEERALYGARDVHLQHCRFDGDEDGESALKEAQNICIEHTYCNLRYPFWHDRTLELRFCEMTEACRAPLWYSEDICAFDCVMHGVKALRECRGVRLERCEIRSPEFGWSSADVGLFDCRAEGEYFMLRAENLVMKDTDFHGKYSFQYVKDCVIENCMLDTKDAFWHAKNVTVRNCTVKGEYLAWYSENLTLIDCRIIGTQPFCYCRGLRLENCEMIDTDLAFERSEVTATVTTRVDSIKNPYEGEILVPSVGELIIDDPHALCRVTVGT